LGRFKSLLTRGRLRGDRVIRFIKKVVTNALLVTTFTLIVHRSVTQQRCSGGEPPPFTRNFIQGGGQTSPLSKLHSQGGVRHPPFTQNFLMNEGRGQTFRGPFILILNRAVTGAKELACARESLPDPENTLDVSRAG
jgi:hypothetical protein